MGEKITTLTTLTVNNTVFDIELNLPSYTGGPKYIHIQNQNIRFNMTEAEFIEFVGILSKAKRHLEHIKKIEE